MAVSLVGRARSGITLIFARLMSREGQGAERAFRLTPMPNRQLRSLPEEYSQK